MLHYQHLRKLLFSLEAERAHSIVEYACKIAARIPTLLPYVASRYSFYDAILEQEVDGMRFLNPVGLAAGFDKNGTMVESLCALGFSHLEVGAVTPLAQSGNEKPRLWRHISEESLQNAMGFNNDGANAVSMRLDKHYPFVLPLGINLGKNHSTTEENALEDYISLAKVFAQNSNYLSINLSSPNTQNLRNLQNEAFVKELLNALRQIYQKPIYLKISPDLEIDTALNLVEVSINAKAEGIIATNTTLDHSLLTNPQDRGGISGKALTQKAREMLKHIALSLKAKQRKTTLISVGGIANAQEAYARIRLGANLVQIFSAMIFEGPSLVRSINKGLKEALERDGFNHISEAVGVDL